MKSRKVQIAVLSLALAWGGFSGAAGAASRPAGAPTLRSGIALWLHWVRSAWIPAWDKSRGTMDPDGTPTTVPTIVPLPATPATPHAEDSTHSRGIMDPDGGQGSL
jgi:hypothetical protein